MLRIETAESKSKPGSIELTVADTGPGVAGPELDRMFEPFVSSKADGLGMGLSINRSIVAAHGGHIVATRNPDRGLTLHVTLPTARTGPANLRPSTLPGPDEGRMPATGAEQRAVLAQLPEGVGRSLLEAPNRVDGSP